MGSRAKNQGPYPSASVSMRPYGVSSHNVEVNNDLTICLLRLIKIYLACIDEISAKKYNISPQIRINGAYFVSVLMNVNQTVSNLSCELTKKPMLINIYTS